jgi:hypothetical protein
MDEFRKEIKKRLDGLGLHRHVRHEIIEEWALHLEERYEERQAEGFSKETAHYTTLG